VQILGFSRESTDFLSMSLMKSRPNAVTGSVNGKRKKEKKRDPVVYDI